MNRHWPHDEILPDFGGLLVGVVGIAQKLVVIVATLAGLLGAVAEAMPDAVPSTVPAACVKIPVISGGQLQAGYCPE